MPLSQSEQDEQDARDEYDPTEHHPDAGEIGVVSPWGEPPPNWAGDMPTDETATWTITFACGDKGEYEVHEDVPDDIAGRVHNFIEDLYEQRQAKLREENKGEVMATVPVKNEQGETRMLDFVQPGTGTEADPAPQDDWYDRFHAAIKMPTGLYPFVDPAFVGDRVTEFLTSLQQMNKDAYIAGIQEGKS